MIPTVLYIDEEPKALRVNGRALQRCFGDEAKIVAIEPEMFKEKMVETIFSYENIGSVIIDQKLKAAGTADYFGTELAVSIRQLDRKIPVYILTNFAQELDPENGDIEYVLSKDDLIDSDKVEAISARLRRHLNIFKDITTARNNRFEELLRKSNSIGLSEEELIEYKEIGFYRERKILASELIDAEELNRKISQVENKLLEVKKLLGLHD
ncbi:hypothetical protein ACSFE6_09040 [Pseudomonas baetica]|uniref:hypothetical protein n=1 Tax=Pseudomonas baetica TaxID=674054 RepID=UPI003EEDDE61